eukprot:scaffold11135_cov246-Chaetoceros_neogracile.AAC.2
MDLAPPALDLFDLDEEFAEPKVRLAQLTNKCSSGHCDDDDLEYFVQEAGCISGLVGHEDGDLSGKEVLHKLFYKFGINSQMLAMRNEELVEKTHAPVTNIEIKQM